MRMIVSPVTTKGSTTRCAATPGLPGCCTASGSEGPSDLDDRSKGTPGLPLAFFEFVRFLRMQSGAGRVCLLQIEFRQPPADDGAARIEIERAPIRVDSQRVHLFGRVRAAALPREIRLQSLVIRRHGELLA